MPINKSINNYVAFTIKIKINLSKENRIICRIVVDRVLILFY